MLVKTAVGMRETNGHAAICASNIKDVDSCGCLKATSATHQSGLLLSQPDLCASRLPCCTTGTCKRCNSKIFQKVRFRLSVGFSKIKDFFRSADK